MTFETSRPYSVRLRDLMMLLHTLKVIGTFAYNANGIYYPIEEDL